MHDPVVRVLLVEDDEDDYVLTRDLLVEGFGGRVTVEWASTRSAGLELLTEALFDVALLDFNLGRETGLDLLREARARGCRTPVIMLTGQDDRTTDLNAMHAGAADYLVKGRVTSDMLERAIRYARELYAGDPDKYFYADQYSNDANWRAHYIGTANEIWQQTQGRVTHFVSMLGTSGTFVGTTRRLKELNPRVQCISLQPDSAFHGIEGAKHMESAIVPKIYDAELADQNIEISTEASYKMVKRMAREEGLLVGISSGAAVVGCMEVASRLKKGQPAVIVTVLCDSGDKYLSERFWDEA